MLMGKVAQDVLGGTGCTMSCSEQAVQWVAEEQGPRLDRLVGKNGTVFFAGQDRLFSCMRSGTEGRSLDLTLKFRSPTRGFLGEKRRSQIRTVTRCRSVCSGPHEAKARSLYQGQAADTYVSITITI